MAGKLTDVAIKKAKSGTKPHALFDGGGLYISIEPTGGKLWRYQYRFEGKRKLLALGKYPDVRFIAVLLCGSPARASNYKDTA